MKTDGWIYDAYLESDNLTFWLKTVDNRTLKLTDTFPIELYAHPKKRSVEELASIIAEHPLANSTSVCSRYLEICNTTRTEVVQIIAQPSRFRKLILDLEATGICVLYNTDLNPVQRYFFDKEFQIYNKFTVEYDEEDYRITSLRQHEEETTPQLTVLKISFDHSEPFQKSVLDSNFELISIPHEQRPVFYNMLRDNGLTTSSNARILPGKIILDSETFDKLGIAGLDEESKFANLPIGTVVSWGPARIIDSRQCYEAYKRKILLPSTRAGVAGNALTAKEVAYTDRGALILSPRVGLHENVGELDFESLFPNIIVNHNISYETVTANGIQQTKLGLLTEITQQFLERRISFKHQKHECPENSMECRKCAQREVLLKKLLVCLYGYSGSDLNRFGNVFTYREVNRIGRETVVKAMNIALKEGFELIYLDTDSVFVKKTNATHDDYENLANKIREETSFPISVANHYRYLVLLTQEADPEIEAARRFYGKLTNGQVFYRGIELRRHDSPIFLKHFQQQLLNIILEAENHDNITNQQLPKAIRFTVEMVEKIRSGSVPVNELIISKMLRMPIERYRSLFPHVTAAVQLRQKQKLIKPGEQIDYVYVDTTQINPINRVVPAEYAETYDVEKYAEMLLDIAESILGVFGFTRTKLGFQSKPRNFLEELRSERTKEILMELNNLQP